MNTTSIESIETNVWKKVTFGKCKPEKICLKKVQEFQHLTKKEKMIVAKETKRKEDRLRSARKKQFAVRNGMYTNKNYYEIHYWEEVTEEATTEEEPSSGDDTDDNISALTYEEEYDGEYNEEYYEGEYDDDEEYDEDEEYCEEYCEEECSEKVPLVPRRKFQTVKEFRAVGEMSMEKVQQYKKLVGKQKDRKSQLLQMNAEQISDYKYLLKKADRRAKKMKQMNRSKVLRRAQNKKFDVFGSLHLGEDANICYIELLNYRKSQNNFQKYVYDDTRDDGFYYRRVPVYDIIPVKRCNMYDCGLDIINFEEWDTDYM